MDSDKPQERILVSSSDEMTSLETLKELVEFQFEGIMSMFDTTFTSPDATPDMQCGALQQLLLCLTRLDISEIEDRMIKITRYTETAALVDAMSEEEKKECITAYLECRWMDIISHKKLRKKTSGALERTLESSETQAKKLHVMFSQQFQGDSVEELVRGIQIYNSIYVPQKHFGRTISVVQSRGTGKSRLVYELRKTIPTLLVCLRSSTNPRKGWPLGDEAVTSFFSRTNFMGEEIAAAFLGALFETIAKKWDGLQWPEHGALSVEKWMTDWELEGTANFLSTRRHKSFLEVTTLAKQQLQKRSKEITELREEYDRHLNSVRWHGELFERFCLPGLEKLTKFLSKRGERTFILSFDEYQELGPEMVLRGERNIAPGMSLIALMRILKMGDEHDLNGVTIWYLLLDKKLSLDLFPKREKPYPSAWPSGTERFFLPPWPYVGFNQMVSIQLPVINAGDVNYIRHLKYYGRPVGFYGGLTSSCNKLMSLLQCWASLPNEDVLSIAQRTLFGGRNFNFLSEEHVLAAFSSRMGLELGESEKAQRLAINAVHSHMRLLVGIRDHVFTTNVPSEPILAIASALALTSDPAIYEDAVKTLVEELIMTGIVLDRGLHGDIFGRLIMTIVRDKSPTEYRRYLVEDTARGQFVTPVRLSDFLQTLLGRDLGVPDGDGSTKPQVDLREELLNEGDESFINFTHFTQPEDVFDELSPEFLAEAWKRGTAFQCVVSQPILDGFIVAYRGDMDRPFDVSKLFVVGWKIRAKLPPAGDSLVRQLTSPFISGSPRRRPCHVVIFMDLASDEKFEAMKSHCLIWYEKPIPKQPIASHGAWAAQTSDEDSKRFCVNVRGFQQRAYPQVFWFRFDELFERMTVADRVELSPMVSSMKDKTDSYKKFFQ